MLDHRQLMIFGLHRDEAPDAVCAMVGICEVDAIRIEPIPGDNDQAVAFVRVGPHPQAALHLAMRLQRQRHRGRQLRAWVSSMPWA